MISKLSNKSTSVNSSNKGINIIRLMDSAFLTIIVIMSAVLYLSDLGFYSDDWFHLAEFITSDDQSFNGLFLSQWNHSHNLHRKPTQILYQTTLYSLFGIRPLGYHIVNSVMLSLMSILLYWTLRQLGIPRLLAVAISAVYALIPNYSTDRFWWAAFGYTLTMCLYFLSLYADLRAIQSNLNSLIIWKLLAIVGLIFGSLSYEIIIPLFFLNPLLVCIQNRRFNQVSLHERLGTIGIAVYFGSHFLVLALVIAYKSLFAIGGGFAVPDTMESVIRFGLSSIGPNFGTYVLGLPQAFYWAFQNSSGLILVMSLILGAFVFIYITHTTRAEETALLSEMNNREWLRLAGGGIFVFLLGYSIFFVAIGRIIFASSSYGNRWAIAGALGVSIFWISLLGWLNNLLPKIISRKYGFPVLVAVLCSSGFLINNTLAQDHVAAWSEEKLILDEIRTNFPKLKPNTTLILLGSCPYIGSAMVFARYDLEGALWVMYRDKTLRADVGSKISVEPTGLVIDTFDHSARYPYNNLLFIYDRERKLVKSIPDMQSALDYFGTNKVDWPNNCPQGTMDIGAPIFPADKLYIKWKIPNFP